MDADAPFSAFSGIGPETPPGLWIASGVKIGGDLAVNWPAP